MSVQCDCGHGISHCDSSNKDVTCPLCHRSQHLEELLAEYTEREEAERQRRYGQIRRLAMRVRAAAGLSYGKALAEARRVGASRATGDAELAQACFALSHVHAVNPGKLYEGAKARGLSAKELVRLARDDLGAFAFIPFDAP